MHDQKCSSHDWLTHRHTAVILLAQPVQLKIINKVLTKVMLLQRCCGDTLYSQTEEHVMYADVIFNITMSIHAAESM